MVEMIIPKLCSGLLLVLVVASCARIAIMTAPKKIMSQERTAEAIDADEFFWTHFHLGHYHRIDDILLKLKAAYLKDPNDWLTASHLGFVHFWQLAERARRPNIQPSIIDDAVLARWYFEEAHNLNPKDPRIKGFLADAMLTLGFIGKDEKKNREGYFLGLDAIEQWPEFNLFTMGYIMSTKPSDHPQFKEALQWQWQTLDLCAKTKVDRKNPDYSPYMKNEEDDRLVRKRSACWNSWIAPHNFEGFFLNMGDMLMKAGEIDTAVAIYNNARLSSTFEQWPYRNFLEQRLVVARVARERIPEIFAPKPMMAESSFSCMACHQAQ